MRPLLSTSQIKSRIKSWLNKYSFFNFYRQSSSADEYLEDNLKDRSKIVLLSRKSKKKKAWVLEFQWKSQNHFNSFRVNKRFRPWHHIYDEHWHSDPRDGGGRFAKASGALQSYTSFHKQYRWRDLRTWQNWRVRNSETHEIIAIADPDEKMITAFEKPLTLP
jgi:hypothetical protein